MVSNTELFYPKGSIWYKRNWLTSLWSQGTSKKSHVSPVHKRIWHISSHLLYRSVGHLHDWYVLEQSHHSLHRVLQSLVAHPPLSSRLSIGTLSFLWRFYRWKSSWVLSIPLQPNLSGIITSIFSLWTLSTPSMETLRHWIKTIYRAKTSQCYALSKLYA